jgi:hypothetical protein
VNDKNWLVVQFSPVESAGLSPLDSTGLKKNLEPLLCKWLEWTPVDSGGLQWTYTKDVGQGKDLVKLVGEMLMQGSLNNDLGILRPVL